MNEQTSPIRKLLEQARAGDATARDQLFQSCRNYVAVVARAQMESWMRAKVDASDLVQQTFLEAHRGFQNFQGQSEAEWLGWLKQILDNNARDMIRHYRTDKRQAGLELQQGTSDSMNPLGNLVAASTFTPSRVLMAHEQELALADAITQLPEDYQTVLQLRSLQRLPFDEVADRMNRSRPATQMLWMRAVQKLEELMNTDPHA